MSALVEELLWLAEEGGTIDFAPSELDRELYEGCVISIAIGDDGESVKSFPRWSKDLTKGTRCAAIELELPYWIAVMRRERLLHKLSAL